MPQILPYYAPKFACYSLIMPGVYAYMYFKIRFHVGVKFCARSMDKAQWYRCLEIETHVCFWKLEFSFFIIDAAIFFK